MEAAQPASAGAGVVFPEPEDKDFDDDIGEEEKKHYIAKYKDLNSLKGVRLHCTACDRHLGCAAKADGRMRTHPMLRTLVCRACHTFYNSGEFERGDDGSELYCRWCGQGGQVYCCSACPHVFCAKCVKRNLGVAKIREIESMDDWKCFKCQPRELWDLRATCWALLRFCDFKNKLAYSTEDAELKEKYQKECAIDESECCKHKKRTSTPSRKKEEKEAEDSKKAIIAKIPSGIQVKKFATVNVDSILRAGEKKAIKRPASPIRPPHKNVGIRAPIPIAPYPRPANPMQALHRMTQPKRMKSSPIIMNHLMEPRKPYTPRVPRPRFPAIQYPPVNISPMPPHMPTMPMPSAPLLSSHFNNFNGYGNFVNSDNINLSLESLTQGLDMASVATIAHQNNDVVCTPDFPIEPVCEVSEDNPDDDVECITPGPVAQPKPPLAPQRSLRNLPDLSPDNIIQMTENDVTVNAITGGLKFRVDPQTLSSNKMYRLPDGRIFAINSNPNMPGGYSATIVAVSDAASGASPSAVPLRGTTYAANLSTVVASANPPPPLIKLPKKSRNSKNPSPQASNSRAGSKKGNRNPDMNTPIEWYRYNLVDAVDALEYSLSRLQRLKKETDSRHLRTRTVTEMRALHLQLERHLHTSSTRFQEIKENLNRGLKSYLKKKGKQVSEEEEEEDDDDVEILPDDPPKHDDPIFIDENSLESTGDASDHEVTALSSEPNDSGEHDTSKDKVKTKMFADVKESNVATTKISHTNTTKSKSDDEEVNNISQSKDEQSKSDDEEVNNISESKDEQSKSDDEEVNNISESKDEQSKSDDEEVNNISESKEEQSKSDDEDVNNISESKEEQSQSDEKLVDSNSGPDSEQIQDSSAKGDSKTVLHEHPDEHSKEDVADQSVTTNSDNLKASDNVEEPRKEVSCNIESQITPATDNKAECESSNKDGAADEVVEPKVMDLDEKNEINEPSNEGQIPDSLDVSEIDESLFENDKNKMNGGSGGDNVEEMDVDDGNSDAPTLSKSADNDLQMSDEMIDTLLADDVTSDSLTADLHKLTERSLDSLADADLVNSHFN